MSSCIGLNKICEEYGIRSVSYSSGQQVIRNHGLTQLANKTPGFCFFAGNQPVIFYDESRPAIDVRFTIAHELGHFMLGHLSFRSDFWEKLPDSAEREADAFAVHLLADELRKLYRNEAAV